MYVFIYSIWLKHNRLQEQNINLKQDDAKNCLHFHVLLCLKRMIIES